MSSRASAAKKKAARTNPVSTAPPQSFLKSESFILGSLLLIATIAVYLPVSHHPFVNFDDLAYIPDNSHIASGLHWETIPWALTTFDQFTWHPLTWISHALDVDLFQLEPGGPHVMNMLFQVANVLLLFWVLRRATGYVGRSAMVAGLFALHPVNVESVAWIAERKNLLSMCFLLLALGAYRWYVSAADGEEIPRKAAGKPQASRNQAKLGRYLLVVLLFAMGLMSKPQIITFPFILLLWDYWPLRRMAMGQAKAPSGTQTGPPLARRSFWWLVQEKIPLFALCAGSALMTVVSQKLATLEQYPFSIRLGNAIVCYVRYIGKAFWPTKLAPMYPHPWHDLPLAQVVPCLATLLVITAAVLFFGRERGYLPVGWFWFMGALVPMIGVVSVSNMAMADRYGYLPFIGLFIMVCWGVAELAESLRIPVLVVRCAAAVVLIALGIATHRQLSYWNDNVTLWTHTLAVTQDNYIAHDNLAQLLMDQGHTDEAMAHYRAALAIYGSDPSSNLSIAVYDHQHGDLRGAIARYQQMISITPAGPARAELISNEGLVYLDMQDNADAKSSFQQAVGMDPHNVRGWLGLGVVADRSGDLNTAIESYKHANTVKPMKVTYLLLARALQRTGDTAGAQEAGERAKMLSRDKKADERSAAGIFPQ